MKTIQSLDPRINRVGIPAAGEMSSALEEHEEFETFEVFHQAKTGGKFIHVGSVHAPEPELAFLFAKEQYGRRQTTVNLWVVRTSDIFTTSEGSSQMFYSANCPEKEYRNAAMYKVRDKIDRFKKQQK